MLHYKKERFEAGFTLIELLVVVIIIGVLASIALPTFLTQRERAWQSEMKSDLRVAAVAFEAYYVDHGTYGQDALLPDYGYTKSPGTTLTVLVLGSGQSYCLHAEHDRLIGETWQLGTGVQLSPGDCT